MRPTVGQILSGLAVSAVATALAAPERVLVTPQERALPPLTLQVADEGTVVRAAPIRPVRSVPKERRVIVRDRLGPHPPPARQVAPKPPPPPPAATPPPAAPPLVAPPPAAPPPIPVVVASVDERETARNKKPKKAKKPKKDKKPKPHGDNGRGDDQSNDGDEDDSSDDDSERRGHRKDKDD